MSFIICLLQQGRLSDDDSADTLDELDPPAEKGQSLKRLQANEEQNILPIEKAYAVPPNESRYVLCAAGSLQQLCNSTTVVMWETHWPRAQLHIERGRFEPCPGILCRDFVLCNKLQDLI